VKILETYDMRQIPSSLIKLASLAYLSIFSGNVKARGLRVKTSSSDEAQKEGGQVYVSMRDHQCREFPLRHDKKKYYEPKNYDPNNRETWTLITAKIKKTNKNFWNNETSNYKNVWYDETWYEYDHGYLIPAESIYQKFPKKSFTTSFFTHKPEQALQYTTRYEVIAHTREKEEYPQLQQAIQDKYYLDKSWMHHTDKCVATITSNAGPNFSFFDIPCYIALNPNNHTKKELSHSIIEEATAHLRNNLGKGTNKTRKNNSEISTARLLHTGWGILKNGTHEKLMPNKEKFSSATSGDNSQSFWTTEANGNSIPKYSHVSVQCLDYKGIIEEIGSPYKLNEKESILKTLLEKEPKGVYTCDEETNHVLVNLEKLTEEKKRNKETFTDNIAHQACAFLSAENNGQSDPAQTIDPDNKPVKHHLRQRQGA
jgi:hypothetical protein